MYLGYVGYSPTQSTVVVGHQGTDPSELSVRNRILSSFIYQYSSPVLREADLTDLDFSLENLDPTLFPGVDASVMVHSGFANEQAQ